MNFHIAHFVGNNLLSNWRGDEMMPVFAVYYDPGFIAWSIKRIPGRGIIWIEFWRFALKIGMVTR